MIPEAINQALFEYGCACHTEGKARAAVIPGIEWTENAAGDAAQEAYWAGDRVKRLISIAIMDAGRGQTVDMQNLVARIKEVLDSPVPTAKEDGDV